MSDHSEEQVRLCECGCGQPSPLAQRTDKRHGWVRGEPVRFINGHNRRRTPHDYVEEDRGFTSPCWIWQRAVSNVGYGLTRRDSVDGKQHVAHRWYYEQRFGKIPEGLQLDHLCRVPLCCNPDHLEPVTAMVNRQRGNNAKLTPAMIRQIRASPLPSRELARQLGVTHRTVNDVRSGLRWSNVV